MIRLLEIMLHRAVVSIYVMCTECCCDLVAITDIDSIEYRAVIDYTRDYTDYTNHIDCIDCIRRC